MNVTPKQALEAVKRAREQVEAAGITEDTDLVISTLAAAQLVGVNTQSAPISAARGGGLLLPQTFAEWAAGFALDSHYDRFLAAAMYMREKSQAASVTTDDILQLYKKARWERPQNPADVIGKAAKRLLLTEDEDTDAGDGKKRWRITSTGYTYFQGLAKEKSDGS